MVSKTELDTLFDEYISWRKFEGKFASRQHDKPIVHKRFSFNRPDAQYDNNGYVIVRCPPEHKHISNWQGYTHEHKLRYEQEMKVCLLPWSAVHHTNGIRDDNRIENLIGMMKSKHMSMHIKKDLSNRSCKICGTSAPTVQKRGYVEWFRFRSDFICRSCHQRAMYRSYLNNKYSNM